ncbi:MAG TPA: hypothetical protein VGM54_06190 [Chthoniobacter sp.]|jgi:hypothetical protein
MAKLFIGISAAFMLATALVSFMLKGKVDALQANRKDAIGKISIAEARAKTATNEATKAQEAEKAATEKLAAATEAATTAKKESEDAKKDIAEKQVMIDTLNKKIADAAANPAANPDMVPKKQLEEAQANLADMTTQRDNAVKERDEKAQLFESTVAKSKASEEELAKLLKEKHDREAHIARTGLRARILAVNGGWNFVVLSVGDKQGITVDDPLIVVRGNEPVAKLRITSVEPSTSIADVIPSSVRRGISIQPGDTVIFQGRTPATMPDNKPTPEAPTNVTTAPVLPSGQ